MTSPSAFLGDDGLPLKPGESQTNWALIEEAGHGSAEAWEEVARRYWPAVYAYVRSTGRDVHDAADLTQGFVADVMIGRGLVSSADPQRGRFRALMRTALKRYLVERHRRGAAQKRTSAGGAGTRREPLPLDRVEPSVRGLATSATPDAAFDTQWAVVLVRRVLDRLREQCDTDGFARHWTVFDSRVVRPMMDGDSPVPYDVLVDRLALTGVAQAANMMVTIKRRFARALYEEVGGTVRDRADIDSEIRALRSALEASS